MAGGLRSKAPSWAEITQRATAFAGEWAKVLGEERKHSQAFWIRFFDCFGVRAERIATFEHGVQRFSTEARGYIDLFWPGMLLVEQKSAGKSLDEAKFQALDYLPDLKDHELPKLIIMCDFRTFRGLVLSTGEEFQFGIEELPTQSNLDRFGFIAGYKRVEFGSAKQEAASIEAAKLMSNLYEQLRLDQYPDEASCVFLTRILFLMFGDDTGLWEPHLFSEYIRTRTSEDGSDLGAQLSALFQVVNTDVPERSSKVDSLAARFPYINGHLFAVALEIPYFDSDTRDVLLLCCAFDWGEISPAVFGSLFQAVKSKAARRELGEHYTTESNILKTVRPLLLDEIRARMERNWRYSPGLQRVLNDLSDLRIFDPACGCGNFLVVTYRELRQIELDIKIRIRELQDDLQMELVLPETLAISIDQFFGIEIDLWPSKIAEVAMFLVDHLANQRMARELGWAPNRLPLTVKPTIVHDNALRMDWRQVVVPSENVVILGNPPFLGHDSRTKDQAEELRSLWGKDIGRIDYVTGWYAKAIEYYHPSINGRWAFVSTSSITQGEPVSLVFGRIFDAGWRIGFAHRVFAWSSEAPGAAAVHCVIIGFSRGGSRPRLFDYTTLKGEPTERAASFINAYLVDGPNELVKKRQTPLSPSLQPVDYGSRPNDGGAFIIEDDQLEVLSKDAIARKYVRRLIGARELLHNKPRWVLWMKEICPEDLTKSPLLKERLEQCKAHRLKSGRENTRKWADRPHLFDFDSQPVVPYLAIPAHSSETRRFMATQRFESDVIATNAVFTTPDVDGFQFSVLSSSMFMAWQKVVGGRLESRIRFSNTLVWNNFPLPDVTAKQRASIIDAGIKIVEARDASPGRSLAEHYHALVMEPVLLKAHAYLDSLIDVIFGAKKGSILSEYERQMLLFAKYKDLREPDQAEPKKRLRKLDLIYPD